MIDEFSLRATSRATVRRVRSLIPVSCLITVFALPVSGGAQSIAFTGVQTQVIGSGANLNGTYGVAADAAGNLYVTDSGNSQVVKFGAGGAVPTTLGTGLSFPSGVAVDVAGNVYIADTGNNRVVEVPVGGGAQITIGSGFSYPTGVAVDPSGNIIVADSNNGRIMSVPPPPSVAAPTLILGGLSYPEVAVYDTAAGGYLIADSGNNRVIRVNGGQVTVIGSGFNYPSGVVVDNAGNIYVADSGNGQVVEVPWGGGAQYAIGSGFTSPAALSLDFNGNLYVADSSASTVTQEMMGAVRFQGGNACPGYTCSGVGATLNFQLTNASTYDSVKTLTGGAPNGDFYQSSKLTCTAPVSGISTCTSQISFYPSVPGLRAGVFQIGLAGATLVSVPLYGIGQGPQVAFNSSARASLEHGSVPSGVVVDAAGNLYYSSELGGAVYELAAGSGTPTSLLAGTFSSPWDLALDGAGNLYVADSGIQQVMRLSGLNTAKITATPIAPGSFPQAVAVKVDGAGNVYVVDIQKGLLKVPSEGGVPISLNPTYTGSLLALDSAGNLFVESDSGRGVMELPAGGGAPVTVASGFQGAQKAVVDAAGDVYVADSVAGNIVEILPGGAQVTLMSGLNEPDSVAMDAAGNIFFSDNSGQIWKNPRLTLPAIDFGSAVVNTPNSNTPQTIGVANIGNQPLMLVSFTFPMDFPMGAGSNACANGASLNGGQSCDLDIEFQPTQAGTLLENLGLVDNSINGAGAVQSIPLTGIAQQAQSIIFPALRNVTFGVAPITLTASAPGGPASFTVTGPATVSGTMLTITGVGMVTVRASQGGNGSYIAAPDVVRSFIVDQSAGSFTVGAKSSALPVTFMVASAVTLGKPLVVTQGAVGMDFTDAGTGTCVSGATLAAGATCTVNVFFAPKYPGQRMGAVQLFDHAGNLLGTQFLPGIGVAPQAELLPAVQKPVTYNPAASTSFANVNRVAVDGAGNLYVAGGGSSGIVKIPATPAGVSIPVPVTFNAGGQGIDGLSGDIAVDGAGDLFVEDYGMVMEKHAGGGSDTFLGNNLSSVRGLTVDGAGTVYVSSGTNITEIPADGGAQANLDILSKLPGGLALPTSLAVDSVGNLYILDAGSLQLWEIPVNGGPAILISALPNPADGSIAVDAAGDVFYVSQTSVTEFSGGVAYTLASNLQQGRGVALDGAGNLYVADSNASTVTHFSLGQAVAQGFANSDIGAVSIDSPRTVQFANIGNQAMTVTSIAAPEDFPADASAGTCAGLNTLQAGASCTLNVDFKPASSGAKSESVTFNDNSNGVKGATQRLTVTGTGRIAQVITLTGFPSSLVYKPGNTLTLNAAGGMSGNPVTLAITGGTATLTGNLLSNMAAGQLSITANQTGNESYSAAKPLTEVAVIAKATPTLSWATPASIQYLTPLSAAQLNATASVPGTVTYSPELGSVLPAGVHTLSATFTPTDASNYNLATASVQITVTRTSPTVLWSSPGSITYGTLLSSTQLNASAGVPGSFVYTPAAGARLTAGTHALSVAFTPTDSTNFNVVTLSCQIVVFQAVPVINWPTPAAISFGKALTTSQLNATANVAGTLTYTPAPGAVLAAGTQTLNVKFVPTDSTDYMAQSAFVSLVVEKATPVVNWATPTAITYGTGLSATQLNATSSVAGTYQYIPALGTVLIAGTQTLTVNFTPTDLVDYLPRQTTVTVQVKKATPVVTWAAPAAISYGTPLSATQLNASAAVAGSLVYTPLAGVVLAPGARTLSVTFTPTDKKDYVPVTTTVVETVNKAVLTVTANNLTKGYGAALPNLGYAITGFVNGDIAVHAYSGSPSVTATAKANSPAGSYPITPAIGTLASSNYTFKFVPGALVISKGMLTFTASSLNEVYGSALPTLTESIVGYVNGDTALTAFTGSTALATTARAKSGVGVYPITPAIGTAVSTNYTFKFVPGTLTVTRAVLTVTALNRAKIYGATVPGLGYAITGLVNGDLLIHSTTGAPSLTTTALATSAVGNYSITAAAGTLAASNYSFSFVAGTLSVTKAVLTLAATNVSVVYNQPLPALTYSVTGFVNADTAAVLSGAVVETTTAVVGSALGSYPITLAQGTLTASNYSFVLKNGTLVVKAIGTVATPTFKPAGGTYKGAQSITITDTTPGAVLYYTVDGTVPTTGSTKYAGPVAVSATETITVLGTSAGYTPSAVARAAYVIQ